MGGVEPGLPKIIHYSKPTFKSSKVAPFLETISIYIYKGYFLILGQLLNF